MHVRARKPHASESSPCWPAGRRNSSSLEPERTFAAHVSRDLSSIPPRRSPRTKLQAKLSYGAAPDAYENEAERIAEQAANAHGPVAKPRGAVTKNAASVEAPPIVDAVLSEPGRPLDTSARSLMESRLGHDFSAVRVLTSARAAEAASAVHSVAFTVGQRIVFGANRFAPSTPDGRRLLAHELVHTVQQGSAAMMQRQAGGDGGTTVIVAKGQTLYSIAKDHGTTVAELQKLNNLATTEIKIGQKLKLPAKAPVDPKKEPAPAEAGSQDEKTAQAPADAEAPKRLLIAWTVDDGPRRFGPDMQKTGLGATTKATWFIQYNLIKENWKKLRDIQANGGEIGIHSFHPTAEHLPWFPNVEKGGVYGQMPKGERSDMAARMTLLAQFKQKLNDELIYPKFVRLPGGLTSELQNYAIHLGYDENKAPEIAKAVIAGSDISAYGAGAKQMASDFALLKKTLTELNLLLWGTGNGMGVSADPAAIGLQEWTSETSGDPGRVDTTTSVVDPKSKTAQDLGAKTASFTGDFEKLTDTMKPGDVRGMVILTHESGTPDVNAVANDRKKIEDDCKAKGISLEYHTMSSLFGQVTGKDVSTYKVNY
jgi:murein DD-endopeptidase MepM/ murein hydrolase activator NlpD